MVAGLTSGYGLENCSNWRLLHFPNINISGLKYLNLFFVLVIDGFDIFSRFLIYPKFPEVKTEQRCRIGHFRGVTVCLMIIWRNKITLCFCQLKQVRNSKDIVSETLVSHLFVWGEISVFKIKSYRICKALKITNSKNTVIFGLFRRMIDCRNSKFGDLILETT